MSKTAIIIGAGPAGLTAAHELLARSDIKPIVLERSEYMGGISRTVRYKGNRIDIGGHRFFSKSDRVMNWWLQVMPLSASAAAGEVITYQQKTRQLPANAPQAEGDAVMLLRRRKSRIYFLRKFFDYPIRLSKDTLVKLGAARTVRIGMSYLRTSLFPNRVEENLEHFFINRFGRELYKTFFQSYTEKVWGVPCSSISAAWGAQRIKGLSIRKALAHAIKQLLPRKVDVAQKNTETSLIEQFLYPKFGPGQLWELVAERVQRQGGEIHSQFRVTGLRCRDGRIVAVTGADARGNTREFAGDYFFSTMPIQELVRGLDAPVPAEVRRISDGLMYRDFVTVGLLAKKMKVRENGRNCVEDNWIYIQEPDVLAGRLQIFNNWSPFMVADPEHVWIGVEYFCNEGDALWNKSRDEMTQLAIEELDKIGILEREDVLDSVVIKMEKTYPAYFGTYDRFDELRAYLDNFENLFLIGRNGMHKYNNQDHAMLTAMTAVDNILAGRTDKSNIWEVNTEMEYHETKSDPQAQASTASLRKQVATGAATS